MTIRPWRSRPLRTASGKPPRATFSTGMLLPTGAITPLTDGSRRPLLTERAHCRPMGHDRWRI
jgi:hypothetical protein